MENSNYQPPQTENVSPPQNAPQPVYINRSDLPLKSTAFSIVLSALLPGLGQVYIGYYKQAFMVIGIVAAVITGLSSGAADGLEPLFGIFLGFFYFYQLIDTGRRCSLYNRAVEGHNDAELTRNLELPEAGGARFAGIVLIVIGVLAFMNKTFDVSMDWIEDWWPLGLVAVGVYLLYKSHTEKAAE